VGHSRINVGRDDLRRVVRAVILRAEASVPASATTALDNAPFGAVTKTLPPLPNHPNGSSFSDPMGLSLPNVSGGCFFPHDLLLRSSARLADARRDHRKQFRMLKHISRDGPIRITHTGDKMVSEATNRGASLVAI